MHIAPLMIAVVVCVLWFVGLVLTVFKCYRRCPPNKVLVKWGKGTQESGAQCIHGGATFVWPIIQDYGYLSLDPMEVDVSLDEAFTKDNEAVFVSCRATVAVGTEAEILENAAYRLLGLSRDEIISTAKEILQSQLRRSLASIPLDDLQGDVLGADLARLSEPGLQQIGLVLVNIDINSLTYPSTSRAG